MDAIYKVDSYGNKTMVASASSSEKVMAYHKLQLKTNYEGKMEFYLPFSNPMISAINPLYDEITFERDGHELFRGSLATSSGDIMKTGQCTCYGALAYFKNVFMNPYEYSGTVSGYLNMLINAYNEHMDEHKKIYMGTLSVTDSNDYITRSDSERKTIYSLLSDKLVGKLGGYLRVRVNQGIKYLDYIADYGATARQHVKAGYNLIDFTKETDYQEVYTVIVPEGAKDETTGERLTVASVNNDSIYVINETALDLYGWREIVVQWDDVTIASNLLSKARALSDSYASPIRSMEVRAIDMSHITDVDCFLLGDTIVTGSDYHDIAAEMILSEQDIYALNPENEVLVLGTVKKSYFTAVGEKLSSITENIDVIKKDTFNVSEKIAQAKGLYTTIEQSEEGSVITWMHDEPELNTSNMRINISTAGIHVSPDGGTNYYGMDMDGDTVARLISAVGLSADYILGGELKSLAVDKSGQAITYIDMNSGEIAKFGNIAWIKRESGNESLKWMGDE